MSTHGIHVEKNSVEPGTNVINFAVSGARAQRAALFNRGVKILVQGGVKNPPRDWNKIAAGSD